MNYIMAISNLPIISLILSILLVLFNSAFLCHGASSSVPDTICDPTPYPSFCKSISPSNQGDIHDYTRYFTKSALSSSKTFLSSVSNHLKSTSDVYTTRALQDCFTLSDLNVDFWTKVVQNINSTNTLSSSELIQDLQTLISATLTNYQTCLDSLQQATSSPSINDLLTSLSNGTKLYSISLSLFNRGWSSTKTERMLMSSERNYVWERRLYEVIRGISGRKLLQSQSGPSNNVLVNQTVVVNPDGSGNFTTISDAVNAAPNNTASGNGYYVIYVVAGVYEEYVSIPKWKTYLMMIGDGIGKTIITGNRNVVDGWTTFNSASFAVVAQGFVAVNITFQNTAGASKHQAVALRSGSDLSAFYTCSFEGYQDTLYTHSMRQFYRDCDIYGTIDFIFGNAAVVLQNCNIYARLPLVGQFNTITAQGRTDINQNTGTSLQNCSVSAASDLSSSNGTTKTYLGRPWKEYSRTVFMESFMDNLIDPAGWAEWSGTFALSTLYYAEYDNWGPGSNTSMRVTWQGYHVLTNASDAQPFTVSQFIQGDYWLPATGVPYSPGLL